MKTCKNTEFSYIRELAGYSVKEVASLFGKSERTVYRWENGETTPDESIIQELKAAYEARTGNKYTGPFNFRFIDLFAGIGGLRKAFESIGGKCVFTAEYYWCN